MRKILRKRAIPAAAMAMVAVLLAEVPFPVFAGGSGAVPAAAEGAGKGDAGSAGILFDMDGNGKTDSADYAWTAAWLGAYSLTSVAGDETGAGGYVLNGNNEAADSVKQLIFQKIGEPAASVNYGIDVRNTSRYCINNIGLGTPAGNQTPYGTCWAFAENSAVESAILRAKTGYAGNSILTAGTEVPVLKGLDQGSLMSSLYLATKAFTLRRTGTQRGEGLTLRDDNTGSIYNAGGFLTTAEKVYGNWDGPVAESDEPYSALSDAGSDGIGALLAGSGSRSALLHSTDTIRAHLQDYYIYASPSETVEDAADQLRVWKSYRQSATDTMKQALVKYGALAIMDGTDTETPAADGTTSSFNYNTWMQYSSSRNVTHNHAVTIVGWDDSIPASAFSSDPSEQPEGDGAWLVKNSWGSYDLSVEQYGQDWVDDYFSRVEPGTRGYYLAQQSYNYGIPDAEGHGTGYFWLSYYDHSIAGSAAAAYVDIPDDGYDYDNNYTYQYAISLSNTALALPTEGSRTKVCNVFTAKNAETLKAVSVEAPTTGITAEIKVYTYDSRSGSGSLSKDWNPESGRLVSSQTVTLAEMGLHTVKLDQPVDLDKGEKFAVGERIMSAADNRTAGSQNQTVISWLNLETALADDLQTVNNYSDEVTKVVSNPGETRAYVRQENGQYAWVQPSDLNRTDSGEVFQYGNALIHAYTSRR